MSSGAWLNQTKKVTKNASQVLCKIFALPVKEKKFDGAVLILRPSHSIMGRLNLALSGFSKKSRN